MPQIRTPDGSVLTIDGEVLESEVYGSIRLPSLSQLRWIAEWAPFFSVLQDMATAPTAHSKAMLLCKALAFAAGKTDTEIDDQAVKHATAMLNSPDGRALFDWVMSKVS